ncbi:MAG TPA: sigma-54 dependent transcriptional regulator [Longimicrobiaceae bacterium]|nr:sigma-54 dependent transcriptional regulator [Longimicrobiaceae bacterium]
MARSILLVDDDPSLLRMVQRFFERRHWRVLVADRAREAIALFESEYPAVVVLDIEMPYLDGLELLEILRERDPDSAIVMLTGRVDVQTAVDAMRRGAENFLTKPVDLEHLDAAVERAYEKVALRRQTRILVERQERRPRLDEFTRSPAMQLLLRQVAVVAPADTPVLLQGEAGTGKTWIAREIHARSGRAEGPYVEVSCAGATAATLAAELFGQEKGATPEARQQRRGALELAGGGTLFLDEVGDLPLDLQSRLAKTLESGKMRRMGGIRELDVDVRLIASTHRDLREEVRAGRFREDFYYRIAVFPLQLPPLRERTREDLIGLAQDLLAEIQRRLPVREPVRLSQPAADHLARYSWPGNISELRNVLERAIILSAGSGELRPEHLPAELRGRGGARGVATPDPTLPLEEVEREHIRAALRYHGGNRSEAARSLRISRRTLYDKIRRFGLLDPGS